MAATIIVLELPPPSTAFNISNTPHDACSVGVVVAAIFVLVLWSMWSAAHWCPSATTCASLMLGAMEGRHLLLCMLESLGNAGDDAPVNPRPLRTEGTSGRRGGETGHVQRAMG